MYIHENPNDYTRKYGKYGEEIVRFDNKDKMQTLSRMIDYIKFYMDSHNYIDNKIVERCDKMKQFINEYFNNKGPFIKWMINDENVQTGMKIVEYCINYIEENHIKDRKAINRCWAINCFSRYWRKDFKCQGA